MILTVTMNPSIDMSYPMESLNIDTVNRVQNVSKVAGGKGLNVSRVLHQMGEDLIATGLLGGHFGEFIKSELDRQEVKHDFSSVDGQTRNSIAILHDNGKQTEILESGPTVSETEADAFLKKFDKLLEQCELVTMSGSLPSGLDQSFYSLLIEKANKKGVKVLLDTSGNTLIKSIESKNKPFLIKPNEEEITALIHDELNLEDIDSVKHQLSHEVFSGIEWIIISMGALGAIAKHHDTFYRVNIPKIKVVNPVGSGDSTIAGFAMGISHDHDPEIILKTGMTTGMLNTMEAMTGCVDPDKFDEYFSQVSVEKI